VLFEDKLGALMTNTQKTLTSTEEERFLNNAQDLYINKLADVFELNEKARKALSKLTKTISSSPIATPGTMTPLSDDSVFFDVETDAGESVILRIVEEQAITATDRITVKPITHDQYLANRDNPYKQPYDKLVWRVDIDGIIELIPDATTTLTGYEWRYIEYPIPIEFASAEDLSLLDEDIHRIVDIAVGLALSSLSIGRTTEK
jgi:hypothetical protein